MNPGNTDWNGESGDERLSLRGLLDLGGDLTVGPSVSRASIERGPPAHESQRKAFATGPDARDAALTLHGALHIPSPQAVNASFLKRIVSLVDHRFNDRNDRILETRTQGRKNVSGFNDFTQGA